MKSALLTQAQRLLHSRPDAASPNTPIYWNPSHKQDHRVSDPRSPQFPKQTIMNVTQRKLSQSHAKNVASSLTFSIIHRLGGTPTAHTQISISCETWSGCWPERLDEREKPRPRVVVLSQRVLQETFAVAGNCSRTVEENQRPHAIRHRINSRRVTCLMGPCPPLLWF